MKNALPEMDDYPMDEDRSKNPSLAMQVDAVVRGLYLTGADSVDGVLKRLSDAEERARYVCGFPGLYGDIEYKRRLETYLVEKGYVKLESGRHVLTEAGRERSLRPSVLPLPEQIERELRPKKLFSKFFRKD